jgi:arsenite methyltransferase
VRTNILGEQSLRQEVTVSASSTTDLEGAVSRLYSAGAQEVQPGLCCPVDYDPRLLEAIPPEVLERDYGCGDPSRFLAAGETVLDLGSGGGNILFNSSHVV